MKKLVFATMIGALTACGGGTQLSSGLDMANMDTTVAPGADFYEYATAGWQRNHPLTAEYSRYGSFDILQENSLKQLQLIIDSVSQMQNADGSIEQKIADMYNSAMDSAALQSDATKESLRKFLGLESYTLSGDAEAWLNEAWPRMQRQGVSGLFGMYIGADEKDAKNNIIMISQGGLTLGQKEYYLDSDEATLQIREGYRKYVVALCQHVGLSEADAKTVLDDVMRVETRLAQASRSMTELRDPEANYNKMSYDELKAATPGIDWDAFFKNVGIVGVKQVVVGQPDAVAEAGKVLAEEKPAALRNLFLWHAINFASDYIDDEARALSFDFWGKTLSGKQEDRPRWKRAVSSVEDNLGEALGQLYVARFFPPEAKERMEKLVANLQVALGERIDVQEWMTEETKKVAHDKLDAFYVKVGYPNKWKDYSTLKIGKNYLENILACNEWGLKDMIERHYNKPVDKDEWFMTPQTVNAYYNPTTNEICFPAGILQPPFFDMQADDAFNYGAIGVVIGHEMTHGFDDQGAKYDKEGNLREWWKPEDTKRFTERIQVMREFHDSIYVLPDLHANGSFTLGENMADHGGLMVAFQAFQNANAEMNVFSDDVKDGFTAAQRFFLAYSNVWAQNIREAEIRRRVKSDPHELGKWRVNGQLPHIDAWYEAFHITESDPMFVSKAKRVTIW